MRSTNRTQTSPLILHTELSRGIVFGDFHRLLCLQFCETVGLWDCIVHLLTDILKLSSIHGFTTSRTSIYHPNYIRLLANHYYKFLLLITITTYLSPLEPSSFPYRKFKILPRLLTIREILRRQRPVIVPSETLSCRRLAALYLL